MQYLFFFRHHPAIWFKLYSSLPDDHLQVAHSPDVAGISGKLVCECPHSEDDDDDGGSLDFSLFHIDDPCPICHLSPRPITRRGV